MYKRCWLCINKIGLAEKTCWQSQNKIQQASLVKKHERSISQFWNMPSTLVLNLWQLLMSTLVLQALSSTLSILFLVYSHLRSTNLIGGQVRALMQVLDRWMWEGYIMHPCQQVRSVAGRQCLHNEHHQRLLHLPHLLRLLLHRLHPFRHHRSNRSPRRQLGWNWVPMALLRLSSPLPRHTWYQLWLLGWSGFQRRYWHKYYTGWLDEKIMFIVSQLLSF